MMSLLNHNTVLKLRVGMETSPNLVVEVASNTIDPTECLEVWVVLAGANMAERNQVPLRFPYLTNKCKSK